jgi:sporulation protein YlmC with PRC-barrel domain
MRVVDEGLPIAYEVLEKGVLVYASDGEQVGTVDHVVAAPEVDIFHGLVIKTGIGPRFVAADQVESLHEQGVDLRIDASEVKSLPHPHGAAPAWRDREPGVKAHGWQKFVDMLTGKGPLDRNWSKED